MLREVDFKLALDELRRQQAGGKRWAKAKANTRQKLNALLVSHAADGITDEYLALLAHAYVVAVSEGQDKPTEHLAELTGKTHSAIKNNLWQATQRGLLERSQGRSGGKTTAKARNLIAPGLGLHGLFDQP